VEKVVRQYGHIGDTPGAAATPPVKNVGMEQARVVVDRFGLAGVHVHPPDDTTATF